MDIFFSRLKTRTIAAVIALLSCVAMVLLPQVAILSAQKGIALWASSVLPALFPFFICANFLSRLGVIDKLNPAAFTFSMSVMSGYPVGAKIIRDLRIRNCISLRDAKRLIAFCSTSGPTFMLGAVGIGMLGSLKAGIIISAAHYLGALFNGIIFSLRGGTIGGRKNVNTAKFANIADMLTEAILEALKSMGIILAYIVLFMFATDLIQFSGLLNLFESIYSRAAVKGIFEMTVGCSSVAYTAVAFEAKTVMCAMLISFGGISIIGQSLSMLSGSGVPGTYFLLTKVMHAFWSGILAFAAVCIFM